jgi:hypothetical protein
MKQMKKRWRIRDQVTYTRTWLVEADSEEAALDQAHNQGPTGGTAYEEEQIHAEPYTATQETKKARSRDKKEKP